MVLQRVSLTEVFHDSELRQFVFKGCSSVEIELFYDENASFTIALWVEFSIVFWFDLKPS